MDVALGKALRYDNDKQIGTVLPSHFVNKLLAT
jgi:hypothetical protein